MVTIFEIAAIENMAAFCSYHVGKRNKQSSCTFFLKMAKVLILILHINQANLVR